MTKKFLTQTGSAHVVIIVILVVVITGALGYVFWNTLFQSKEDSVVTGSSQPSIPEQTESIKTKTLMYETDGYLFNYPADNWQASAAMPYIEGDEKTVFIRTTDYAQTGMGLDAGAEVAITVFRKDDTLENIKKSVMDFANGTQYSDLKDITVAGVDAFSYKSAYEGMRYHTVFLHEGLAYDIVYQYGINENVETYKLGYETIVPVLL